MCDANMDSHDQPFVDKVYLLSTVLDPRFGLHWVDIDVFVDTNQDCLRPFKRDLKEMSLGIKNAKLQIQQTAVLMYLFSDVCLT